MKWTKASEMMPMMQTRCVLKHIGANTIHLGNFDKNEEGAWLFIQCSNAHAGWSVADEGSNFENWEWLDESGIDATFVEIKDLKTQLQQGIERERELEEALRQLYENIWSRFHREEDKAIESMTPTLREIMSKAQQLLNK